MFKTSVGISPTLRHMGARGTAIFDDDTASDVRGEWRDAIIEGLTAEEVSDRLKTSFEHALADEDESKIFWLALAAAQMETGSLLEDVRDRALRIIDAGGDVARWAEEDEGLARQRQRVLNRLAEKLRGLQPKPKKIRPPRVLAVPFDVGDVIHVRDPDGQAEALFLVVDQADGVAKGEQNPVLAPLLWVGGPLPPREELERLPVLVTDEPDGKSLRAALTVATTHRKDSVFGPHLGEVIAKGVIRQRPGDHRNGAVHGGEVVTSWAEWPTVARVIKGGAFRRKLELTRSHAQRRGK
jgi:hypothetical protein